ncbi:MAG: AAA family ATPase [Verrucomicrobiota bacterium]
MIIGLTNSKGGVGKTTIAVHLVKWLSDKGRAPIFVDADVQSSSSGWVTELDSKIPLHRIQSPDELIEDIPTLLKQSDWIVIDGPAGLSEVTRAIMFRADEIFLPCGPSILDLRAANDAIRLLKQAQSIRAGAPNATFIPNKLQRNYRLSRELISASDQLGIKIAPGIGLRQAFADAAGQGSVVWEMGKKAQKAASEMTALFEEIAP